MRSYVGPASLVSLLTAAMRLDRITYSEVVQTGSATHQCLAVTALAAISQAALIAPRSRDPVALVVIASILLALAGVLARAALLLLIGKLGAAAGPISIGSALRPLSLASAPGIFYVIGAFLEPMGPSARWASEWVLGPLVGAWALAATALAVGCALERRWPAALLVALFFRLLEREVGLLLSSPQ